jgi:galactonate dehydratase
VTLALQVLTIPDPDGHGAALALKGDWVIVAIADGTHVGLGEASHSGEDEACGARVRELFERHVRAMPPSLESIRALESGSFARAGDFLTATAMSALNQALYDLAARRAAIPVWKLLAAEPVRTGVPVYMTINRALTVRDGEDYREAVGRAVSLGVRRVKLAPFEAVTPGCDQLAAARRGLDVLRMLRAVYPDVRLRVDFHERFTPENALALLPELEPFDLDWIEVPCPIGPANAEIRRCTSIPLAAGELYFGTDAYVSLARRGWADVVMPDVKHVGGFGPLLEVCEAVRPFPVTVSPHNPSGAVSTLASLHAAALADNATELELPLHGPGHLPRYRHLLRDGALHLPSAPGWGVTLDALLESSTTGVVR